NRRESEQRIGSFNPQGFANTAWVFATLGMPAPQLSDAIARESEQRIGSFKPQGLAITAWAFATLAQLFKAIARESEQSIGSFNPQGLANMAWAFATLGTPAPQLFNAIARESEQRIGSFNAQNLANTAWAFATLGMPASAPQLFDAIARESEQRFGSFNAQNLANLAWAFATLGTPLPQLFDAIARESEQRIGSFNAQNLASIAWAFAALGVARRDALVKAVNARAAEIGGTAFSSKDRMQLHQFFLSVELELCPPAELLAPANMRLACLGRSLVRVQRPRIAIEVDGPTHYLDERWLRPASEMIRRHLALAGWAVLAVPYWEWDALKGRAKAEYLAALLERVASKGKRS
ncbi:hypothetical protein T492DRAFT_585686, partial [Pavlovales sp. CCMP2436]